MFVLSSQSLIGVPSFSLIAQASSLLSEAQFSAELPETLDPLFKFHETIAKVSQTTCFLPLFLGSSWSAPVSIYQKSKRTGTATGSWVAKSKERLIYLGGNGGCSSFEERRKNIRIYSAGLLHIGLCNYTRPSGPCPPPRAPEEEGT